MALATVVTKKKKDSRFSFTLTLLKGNYYVVYS